MTTPSEENEGAQPESHSCEHCADGAHDAAPDVTAAAGKNLALAVQRLLPRIALGILGLGLALVLADRGGYGFGSTALVYLVAAASWLAAAWLGTYLGALATRRGPHPQLALGQVFASALAPLLALIPALLLLPLTPQAAASDAVLTASTGRLDAPLAALVPGGVAAVFGWFLAAAVGELVGVRTLRSRLDWQNEAGARARQEAESLSLATIQRGEFLALGLAVGFGLMVVVLAWIPWLAVVLVPLCAAVAAWLGMRRVRRATPGT